MSSPSAAGAAGRRPLSMARLRALLTRGTQVEADERIDAGGQLVLPGAIDIHFHCRAPAYPERGDFATETRAAAAGGVTTIFEMPISKPCCATGDVFRAPQSARRGRRLRQFCACTARRVCCDRDEIADMVAEGRDWLQNFHDRRARRTRRRVRRLVPARRRRLVSGAAAGRGNRAGVRRSCRG